MNSADKEKDFTDRFMAFVKPYQTSGVRFLTVVIYFFLVFFAGMMLSPLLIKYFILALPFTVTILQISPLDALFNYVKIGFFFSFFFTLPLFIYQFGKLKFEEIENKNKVDLLYCSSIVIAIIMLSAVLTYKIFFPLEIFILYGLNFNIANFSSSLSAMVSNALIILLMTFLVLMLPFLRILIKKSLFFNYSTFVKYKKVAMIYCAVLACFILLPIEFFGLGILFLIFFGWYKLLIHFSKKRD